MVKVSYANSTHCKIATCILKRRKYHIQSSSNTKYSLRPILIDTINSVTHTNIFFFIFNIVNYLLVKIMKI